MATKKITRTTNGMKNRRAETDRQTDRKTVNDENYAENDV